MLTGFLNRYAQAHRTKKAGARPAFSDNAEAKRETINVSRTVDDDERL